jgi:hypothetical protein
MRGSRHAQVELIFWVPTIAPVAGMDPIKKHLEINQQEVANHGLSAHELYIAPKRPRHWGGASSVTHVGALVCHFVSRDAAIFEDDTRCSGYRYPKTKHKLRIQVNQRPRNRNTERTRPPIKASRDCAVTLTTEPTRMNSPPYIRPAQLFEGG